MSTLQVLFVCSARLVLFDDLLWLVLMAMWIATVVVVLLAGSAVFHAVNAPDPPAAGTAPNPMPTATGIGPLLATSTPVDSFDTATGPSGNTHEPVSNC